jgi:hypothetical protein
MCSLARIECIFHIISGLMCSLARIECIFHITPGLLLFLMWGNVYFSLEIYYLNLIETVTPILKSTELKH